MEEINMRGREKAVLAVPWGLHFNALQRESGVMKRKYFVSLFKRELEMIKGNKTS
jgi:hypothetical protein